MIVWCCTLLVLVQAVLQLTQSQQAGQIAHVCFCERIRAELLIQSNRQVISLVCLTASPHILRTWGAFCTCWGLCGV